MNWREYLIVMKHSGLSWLGHLMPFGLIVALNMGFTSHQVKFQDEMCQCQRFGNSGLFLVFSKDVQEKLYESREKSRKWRLEEEAQEEKEEFERLSEKFSEEDKS